MPFRKSIVLFTLLLLSSLFLLQFWFINNLTKDVSSKIGQAAFEVSRSTVETLVFEPPKLQFRQFAFTGKVTQENQRAFFESLSTTTSDVNIILKDEQADRHITLNSSGEEYNIAIPRTGIEKSLTNLENQVLLSAALFIAIGIAAAWLFSKFLSTPLIALQTASRKIGLGEYGIQIVNKNDFRGEEFSNTLQAFNDMSKKIEQLQAENEHLQKENQLVELTEITRGLAHTLRNPLNTLNLAIDQLSEADSNSNKRELRSTAKHQIQRIDRWVKSMMKITSGNSELKEPIILNEILQDCIDEQTKIGESSVFISFESELPDNFVLHGVKAEVKSIVHSLLSNAIESVNEAKQNGKTDSAKNIPLQQNVKIKLNKKTDTNGDVIVLSISDTGVGFPEKILKKLFNPHNTNKTYGAGMGLYLVHRIISLKYDGNVNVSNRLNQAEIAGSTITLTFKNRL